MTRAAPPPGYHYGAGYRASWDNILRGIIYILRGKPRSLAHDALWAMTNMPAPPLVRGLDLVPERGPFIVVANHYQRPGLWMAWPALYVAEQIRERTGQDTHWIAIEEWVSFSLWGIPIPTGVTHEVFERAFRTYGILAMPPPYAPMTARAASMRTAAQQVKSGGIVGLMPEGDVGPTPELLEAREGAGAFLLLLAGTGARLLPVGLYEEDGRLVAHFGSLFDLTPPADLPRADRDRWARERVMHAIRDLLPEALWGFYAEKK